MDRFVTKWAAVSVVIAACLGSAVAETAGDQVRTAPERHPNGIWKAVVPPGHMTAEFGGHDPLGLAAGAKIQADCSLNWIDPDTGKLYCFSSATSQSIFQDWPQRNIERAQKAWHALNHSGS